MSQALQGALAERLAAARGARGAPSAPVQSPPPGPQSPGRPQSPGWRAAQVLVERPPAGTWQPGAPAESPGHRRRPGGGPRPEESIGAPVPPGAEAQQVALTAVGDMRVAFEMLETESGVLNRLQARSWLRCAGWCVEDSALDQMLDAASLPRGKARAGTLVERTRWGLKQLEEVLDAERRSGRRNLGVPELQAALRGLVDGRAKISHQKLTELTLEAEGLTEADLSQVLHTVGLADSDQISVDVLAQRLVSKVVQPPSPMELHQLVNSRRWLTPVTAAAEEWQKHARTRLEAQSKDLERERREIEEARALAERKAVEARERAQQSPEFALEELERLSALAAADEARAAMVLDAISSKMSGAGLIAKSRAAQVSAGTQRQQVTSFVALVEKLYAQKRGTLLDELLDNLKGTGPQGDATPLEIKLLAEVCKALHDRYSARPLNEGLQDELLAICAWVVYTMQDVDIDRLFCCKDVPELPEGMEEPARRDEFYQEYRQKVAGKRNPQMFQVANWAARVCFDSAGERKDALDGLRTWIRWVCFLGLSAKTLEKPVVVTRGLCGLPKSLVDRFRGAVSGDQIFWAAPSSTTDDASISESYCNQQMPKEDNVLFTISGVTHAFPMMELSAYPKEREWLLPPFTVLVVERVVDGAPLQLHCRFGGCVLTAAFQEQVRSDFVAASERLSMWYAESQREREALRKELSEAEQRATGGVEQLKKWLDTVRTRVQNSRDSLSQMEPQMRQIEETNRLRSEADQELQAARPAMEAAKESMNCLDKKTITELKNLKNPPAGCADVIAACGFLLKGTKKKMDWRAAGAMMNAAGFLDELKNFDARKIPEQVLKNVDELIALPFFNFETMKAKSVAAAHLANWVVNTVMYHKIFVRVAPLIEKVQEAEAKLPEDVEAQIATLQKQIAEGEKECDRLEKLLASSLKMNEKM